MSDTNGDGGILDPELKEELENKQVEDPMITEYGSGADSSDGNEDISFAESWFPSKDEWQGKTIITPDQARALAAARHLPQVFDELEDLEPFLEGFINDYEKYLTSIEGHAREQQADILTAMFGGETAEESKRRDMILGAFAGDAVDNDD